MGQGKCRKETSQWETRSENWTDFEEREAKVNFLMSTEPSSNNASYTSKGLPCNSNGKESACNAGDPGSIPGLGRSSGEGHGNPLQYSCLEKPMDRGACRAIVHGVAESRT